MKSNHSSFFKREKYILKPIQTRSVVESGVTWGVYQIQPKSKNIITEKIFLENIIHEKKVIIRKKNFYIWYSLPKDSLK